MQRVPAADSSVFVPVPGTSDSVMILAGVRAATGEVCPTPIWQMLWAHRIAVVAHRVGSNCRGGVSFTDFLVRRPLAVVAHRVGSNCRGGSVSQTFLCVDPMPDSDSCRDTPAE